MKILSTLLALALVLVVGARAAEEPQLAEGAEFIDAGATSISLAQTREREEQLVARRVEFELAAAKAFFKQAIQIVGQRPER